MEGARHAGRLQRRVPRGRRRPERVRCDRGEHRDQQRRLSPLRPGDRQLLHATGDDRGEPGRELDPSVSQDGSGGVYATFLGGGSGDPVEPRLQLRRGQGLDGTGGLEPRHRRRGERPDQLGGSRAGRAGRHWVDNGSVFAQQFDAADATAPAASIEGGAKSSGTTVTLTREMPVIRTVHGDGHRERDRSDRDRGAQDDPAHEDRHARQRHVHDQGIQAARASPDQGGQAAALPRARPSQGEGAAFHQDGERHSADDADDRDHPRNRARAPAAGSAGVAGATRT